MIIIITNSIIIIHSDDDSTGSSPDSFYDPHNSEKAGEDPGRRISKTKFSPKKPSPTSNTYKNENNDINFHDKNDNANNNGRKTEDFFREKDFDDEVDYEVSFSIYFLNYVIMLVSYSLC